MDRTDVKDMFIDVVGGTSLDEAVIEQMLVNSLTLLDQMTAHQGVDFINDNPMIVVQTMQYYYDLAQRNTDAAKANLVAIAGLVTQINHDFVQLEQADWIGYMGGAVEND